VSNTWVICREDRYNPPKGGLIPDVVSWGHPCGIKGWGPQGLPLREEPAAYQLVGRVTAYQG